MIFNISHHKRHKFVNKAHFIVGFEWALLKMVLKFFESRNSSFRYKDQLPQ